MSSLTIHPATACFPGIAHEQAIANLYALPQRETGPALDLGQCQLCPQNRPGFTPERARTLRAAYPDTTFRLHANVRLGAERQPKWTLSDVGGHTRGYFEGLGEISRALGAPAYSLHGGKRDSGQARDHADLADQRERLEQWMGLPVAVEGGWSPEEWFSSWAEYRWLLDTPGVLFAIDLSHLQIVARRERCRDIGLLRELLTCDRCLEIHVSDNDGRSDRHLQIGRPLPWWWEVLETCAEGITATVFSEERLDRDPQTRRHPAVI